MSAFTAPVRAHRVGVAVVLVASLLAAPAHAQDVGTVFGEARLPDGRAAQLLTVPEGGYRLDIDGALWSGARDGAPADLVVGDIDGDGESDVAVVLAPTDGLSLRTADVWDVTLQGPMLMHVSSAITTSEPALLQLRREVEGRFSLTNGLASLRFATEAAQASDSEADWDNIKGPLENWLGTAHGALIHADVARARARLLAADADSAEAALGELRAALEARAQFAATTSAGLHD